jgi:hypothetical protein
MQRTYSMVRFAGSGTSESRPNFRVDVLQQRRDWLSVKCQTSAAIKRSSRAILFVMAFILLQRHVEKGGWIEIERLEFADSLSSVV